MAKRIITATSDIYTALLGLSMLAVLGAVIYVAVMFAYQYGTIWNLFKISQVTR